VSRVYLDLDVDIKLSVGVLYL